jgi:hypothetical protein
LEFCNSKYWKSEKPDLFEEVETSNQSVYRLHLEFELDQQGNLDIKKDFAMGYGMADRSNDWKTLDLKGSKMNVVFASEVEKAKMIQSAAKKIRQMAGDLKVFA